MKDLNLGETFVIDEAYIRRVINDRIAHDCFGRVRRVTEVFAHSKDANDREFVCFYTEFGPNCQISNSVKVGERFVWVGGQG